MVNSRLALVSWGVLNQRRASTIHRASLTRSGNDEGAASYPAAAGIANKDAHKREGCYICLVALLRIVEERAMDCTDDLRNSCTSRALASVMQVLQRLITALLAKQIVFQVDAVRIWTLLLPARLLSPINTVVQLYRTQVRRLSMRHAPV
jgi:hypothetical protein